MRRRLLTALLIALTVSGIILAWGTAFGEAKWPMTSGNGEKTNSKLKVDIGNSSEGYFLAAVTSSNKHGLKLRVEKGSDTLTYDLNSNGKYEVFPFQLGSGSYTISLWENVSGKKYSAAGKISVNVKLKSESIPFLYPNQYVHYSRKDEAVSVADEICGGKEGKEAYLAIKKYITENYRYDYVKAATIKPSIMPDIQTCYAKKTGVCQDLSALMVCMLRVEGVPARLVIGYADKIYHAWVVAEVDGKKVLFDPTAAVNHSKNASNYSVERYY
ncbi:MAG: transglutaminase family protein [Clostridia bacterium]|nr:transglutaminase family protein [Clostridia bacterium]MBR0406841.1 transglutaminase family protein [Clostridia bacterium]